MASQAGKWAFIIGALLAIIAGLLVGIGKPLTGMTDAWVSALLVIAGLVIGFANITAKEVQGFLIASIAVLTASTANLTTLIPQVEFIGAILAGVVAKLLVVVAPAALIVALRAVYGFAAE